MSRDALPPGMVKPCHFMALMYWVETPSSEASSLAFLRRLRYLSTSICGVDSSCMVRVSGEGFFECGGKGDHGGEQLQQGAALGGGELYDAVGAAHFPLPLLELEDDALDGVDAAALSGEGGDLGGVKDFPGLDGAGKLERGEGFSFGDGCPAFLFLRAGELGEDEVVFGVEGVFFAEVQRGLADGVGLGDVGKVELGLFEGDGDAGDAEFFAAVVDVVRKDAVEGALDRVDGLEQVEPLFVGDVALDVEAVRGAADVLAAGEDDGGGVAGLSWRLGWRVCGFSRGGPWRFGR